MFQKEQKITFQEAMGGEGRRGTAHRRSPLPAALSAAPCCCLSEPRPARGSPRGPCLKTGGCPGRWMEQPRPGRDYGGREEGRPGGRGESREGGREGGRIDCLSSTGTTELSCHGERGAAGRARGGWRSHMPGGRRPRRANPTVLLLQPPPTGPLDPGQQGQRGTGLTTAKQRSEGPSFGLREPQHPRPGTRTRWLPSQHRPEPEVKGLMGLRRPQGPRPAWAAPWSQMSADTAGHCSPPCFSKINCQTLSHTSLLERWGCPPTGGSW